MGLQCQVRETRFVLISFDDSYVIEFNFFFLFFCVCFRIGFIVIIDLNDAANFATLPNLRVRRPSRIVIGSSDEENLNASTSKSRGPEFILNSSLPCQEIDISDSKVTFSVD